ncbi:MAG: hypothetical protein ACYC4H_13025, partial [Desulfocucumaceae bacterium]
MFTPVYPDYSLYLHPVKVSVAEFIKNEPGAITAKIVDNWEVYRSYFLSPDINGVSAALFIVFLVSLVLPLDKKAAGIRPLVVMCYLAQLAALLVIHFIPRLFLIFTPLYIIFALGAISTVIRFISERLGFRSLPGILTTFLIIFLSFYNFTSQCPPEREAPDRDRYLKVLNDLANTIPADKVILTNEGHLVSWYGDRYACKVPYSVEM